jgi:hypothetical protein
MKIKKTVRRDRNISNRDLKDVLNTSYNETETYPAIPLSKSLGLRRTFRLTLLAVPMSVMMTTVLGGQLESVPAESYYKVDEDSD